MTNTLADEAAPRRNQDQVEIAKKALAAKQAGGGERQSAPDTTEHDPVDDDLLIGVRAIAKWRREKTRRTYYLLEHGLLPGWKRGEKWESRKSVIRADEKQRQEEAAAAS